MITVFPKPLATSEWASAWKLQFAVRRYVAAFALRWNQETVAVALLELLEYVKVKADIKPRFKNKMFTCNL